MDAGQRRLIQGVFIGILVRLDRQAVGGTIKNKNSWLFIDRPGMSDGYASGIHPEGAPALVARVWTVGGRLNTDEVLRPYWVICACPCKPNEPNFRFFGLITRVARKDKANLSGRDRWLCPCGAWKGLARAPDGWYPVLFVTRLIRCNVNLS